MYEMLHVCVSTDDAGIGLALHVLAADEED
jgi:hypothetical protein